ncbi:MAG: pullulanase-type alpha-1,6-glucosidase [Rubrivivax sp.]|nr:pullulanase-type alpha-1,6-glucosidase [Rubrivivax sp.]
MRGSRCVAPGGLLAALLLAGAQAWAAVPPRSACDGEFQAVLQAAPAAATPALPAQAVWLNRQLLRWPTAAPAATTASAAPAENPGQRYRLHHSARGQIVATPGQPVQGADGALLLTPHSTALPPAVATRFKWVAEGTTLAVRAADLPRLRALHRGQLVLVQEDAEGRVLRATGTQIAGALDDVYARAERLPDLGARPAPGQTGFKLWAPTAQAVWLCLHDDARSPARQLRPLQRQPTTGVWQATLPRDLRGRSYTYLVDVFVPGAGLVRNRVTDPYSISLNTNSQRSWIGRLDDPRLQPEGWATTARPGTVQAAVDQVVYELHLRDFSVGDASVPAAHRGTYLAFTHADSHGMRHLQALAAAGMTDVHLLPVFDLATVPEQGCVTPDAARLAALPPDSEEQQALVTASAARDCYNWGYDPLHFTAPEGSYATDAADGATRILEFRRMVMALHRTGLRVGMDMVYNHTSASGQKPNSVLDRTVPGYYQRLNEQGAVEMSTCCDNTATENMMMAKLMVESAVVWARDYRIDSMRFDLMGHQPRAAMERLQAAVNRAAGRPIHLLGEGWNFGEVKDGARFEQAAQGRLAGTGIGAFSDRGRDAVRGGGCCDAPAEVLSRQGWLNGLHYAPNPQATAAGIGSREDLLRAADLVRVGLAGTLRDFRMTTFDGSVKTLAQIDYAGQGAGFATQPDEVVNYVENHDNPTLFDIHVLKLPPETTRDDRARLQVLGGAVTAFSQGIAYFHAGVEMLRSKSLDRNSYDSGDWFNRMDWTYQDNFFGSGLPPQADNGGLWPAMRSRLADAALKPTAEQIRYTRDAFLDLLRIRASSMLFRLRTADDIAARLTLLNTGPQQLPTVVVGHLNGGRVRGRTLEGAGFAELFYAINVAPEAATLTLPELRGRAFVLHPVHRSLDAADLRPAAQAHWDAASATLRVPARTALVYVMPSARP